MAYQTPSSLYELKELSLTNNQGTKISIRDMFKDLEFTEDIYQNFMYGKILIMDAVDLQQFFPIVGEEFINFSYNVDENIQKTIDLRFRVYRIESSTNEQERISHILYFVSEEAFNATNLTISKAYNAKSPSIIVSDAFSYISKKKLYTGNFSGRHHIISPNWSPLQLINYIASISKPKSYNGSLVLFFENINGYYFKHIEELIDSPSVGTWEVGLSQTRKENEAINPNNYIQSYKIIKNSIDNLDAIYSGVYANTTLSYDNITKTYKQYDFDYSKEYKNSKHLNLFPLNSTNSTDNISTQKILYYPSNNHRQQSSYYQQKSDNLHSFDTKEIIGSWRTSLINQISAKQIEMELNGDETITAGCVMNIVIPSISTFNNDTHRYNTKKVLVTKVTNTFNINEHRKVVLVSDDSYPDNLTQKGF